MPDKIIPPIDADFDSLAKKMVEPAPYNSPKNKGLGSILGQTPALNRQRPLDLGIQVQKNINGVEMGVLENGLPYLTQIGLAQMAGIGRATVFDISKDWTDKFSDPVIGKGRNGFLKNYLFERGYDEPALFLEVKEGGSVHYAYPDIVCMAILEYYSFEARETNPTALKNYRSLAAFGLQKFIYEALQYTPEDKWKYFNDRVSLLNDSAPEGHFILFSETTGIAVDLINADLPVNHRTLPDISVGLAWGKFWSKHKLDAEFGPRIRYTHNYPSYYPQSASNPQKPWAYPDAALPLFRKWFRSEYLLTKFPKYILTKANVLKGGRLQAEQIVALFDKKLLGN